LRRGGLRAAGGRQGRGRPVTLLGSRGRRATTSRVIARIPSGPRCNTARPRERMSSRTVELVMFGAHRPGRPQERDRAAWRIGGGRGRLLDDAATSVAGPEVGTGWHDKITRICWTIVSTAVEQVYVRSLEIERVRQTDKEGRTRV